MKQVEHSTVAGVDVGKRMLDAAVAGDGEQTRTANKPEAIEALVGWFRSRGVVRVGLEASGGYERELVVALERAGLEAVVHQPAEVRAFARLRRIRAKNDRIDAAVIALATVHIDTTRAAGDPVIRALAERLTAYEQASQALVRAKTALEHARLADVREELLAQIAYLKAMKARLAARLVAAIRAEPRTKARFELLQSLPGVGPVTAAALVARMPELGSMRRGQAASLLGVAPFDRDSGAFKGKRFVWGGRSRPRRFVYLAALAARRCDPALRAFAQRLDSAGKPPKVVLVALMRKLVEAANIVLARGQPWLPQPV